MKYIHEHPLYKTWDNIKQRCLNTTCRYYKNYGARGITIADEWVNDFDMFCYHMGPKPSPKHSIDRVDNDWGYFPENCRWTVQAPQVRNSRRVINAKGCYRTSAGTYQSTITIGAKGISLGTYKTEEEAHAEYLRVRTEFYG